MKNKVNKKRIICIILLLALLLFVATFVFHTVDGNKISEIKEFIKTDVKLLYITNDDKFDYPVKILDKYAINYLKINSDKLTIFEKNKLEKIVQSKKLDNMLIIYNSGNIDSVLTDYNNEQEVNDFLQKNEIIPTKISDDVEDIMLEATTILDNEYSMVYLPYKDSEDIDTQNKIFEKIAKEYDMNYKKIDAYLLSKTQQEKINSLLKISDVENQILLLIKDNKLVASIRGVHSKNTYIENLYELNFIDELEIKINRINYKEFKEEISSKDKSVILIGTDNSKDCNNIFNLLNGMIYKYDIDVSYINVEDDESEYYKKVKEELEELNYEDAFSFPLVVIVESNNILDYIIGTSNEEYYLDIFIENGVIKGEIVNE